MVAVNITYEGELRCVATHGPSGTTLTTDAPKDNQGKGESFSPTDLVATALGCCILSVMGIAARTLNVDLKGSTVHVDKEMVKTPIRRIGKLEVKVYVPALLTDAQKKTLMDAALQCPVHKSLSHEIEMPMEFTWG